MSTTTPAPPTPGVPETPAIPPGRRPRRSPIAVVLRKELLETFRDKRTVFSVIISPLLITPLMLAVVGGVVSRQVKQERVETLPVGMVGAKEAPSVRDALRGAPGMRFEDVTQAEAEERIRARRLRAAIVLPADSEARMREMREVPVRILVDAGSDTSQAAARRLRDLFTERGRRVIARRLMDQGLSSELASPFAVSEAPLKSGGTGATMMLATFLPYVLVISAIIGGLYAANDLVAGEKERGTLETLLVSRASRRDIVTGKFLAVAAVSLVSSFLSIVGLLIPFYLPIPGLDWMAKADLKLSATAIAVMLFVQLPLAVLGAGLLLAISTFSRNQKEAQTYLSPVLIVVTVAAMLSMFLKAESSRLLALVPVLNAAMALKQALTGTVDVAFVAIAFAASIVYAALAIAFATALFQRESVLLKA
uniref:ABC-2 type transporter transmembrane domain-containing protein n=1 Tax=uncultured Armatimonadetes bacterium TaxID=157466 RepID=A0A6J4HYD3_9BACT|nr:hypothetical protein AVDCRST_MAG63-1210 [uncultured Armatimonadetes bacterium]